MDGFLLTLRSGRVIHAHGGILGLGPDLVLMEGYDGTLEWDDMEEPLTRDERRQLADIMIERWRKWAVK